MMRGLVNATYAATTEERLRRVTSAVDCTAAGVAAVLRASVVAAVGCATPVVCDAEVVCAAGVSCVAVSGVVDRAAAARCASTGAGRFTAVTNTSVSTDSRAAARLPDTQPRLATPSSVIRGQSSRRAGIARSTAVSQVTVIAVGSSPAGAGLGTGPRDPLDAAFRKDLPQ